MRTLLAVMVGGLVVLATAENARTAPIAPLAPGVGAALSDVTEASWRRCWRDRWGRLHCRWCWRDRWGRVRCR